MYSQGLQFAEVAVTFAAAAGLEAGPTGGEGKGLLEKKWTSVVRLQRKVGHHLQGRLFFFFNVKAFFTSAWGHTMLFMNQRTTEIIK